MIAFRIGVEFESGAVESDKISDEGNELEHAHYL